jgi:hypothetical protein
MFLDFPAVSTPFSVLSSGVCIGFVVLPTLTVLGCEVVCLEALDPVGCLSIQKLEAEQMDQGSG